MKKILIMLSLVILIAGCDSANKVGNVAMISASPIDYGNGVYYFSKTQASFGNALSAFIKSNPELEITAIAPNGTGGYGADVGYFIVTKRKK
jgi:hypothetical protein